MTKKLLYFVLPLVLLNLAACEKVAIYFTPKKQPIKSTSKMAADAKDYFWNIFHQGDYQSIEKADRVLMAAYLENPNDPELANDLGAVHIWKITERQRQKVQNPLIINEIILAKKYFSDASTLEPNNGFYEGLLADSRLIEGQVFHDKREQVYGYFTLKSAIKKWPEFNYFNAAYIMEPTLSPTSKQFKQALAWEWQNVDICLGIKINRANPDFRPYLPRQAQSGSRRACWDTWMAPHNYEGFCMYTGDLLVKSGDWQTAIIMYNNAKLVKNYSSWPYRDMLEKRIKNASENVINFQKNSTDPNKTIMFNTGRGCVVCHQKS